MKLFVPAMDDGGTSRRADPNRVVTEAAVPQYVLLRSFASTQ